MGQVARLRKLKLRQQRQESLEFASQNVEARKAEIRKAVREEKAKKMSEEFNIPIESAMKVLLERDKIKREKKSNKAITHTNVDETKLQSAGAQKGATTEGEEN